MLKVELHTHTSDDPVDRIPHTTTDLIDDAGKHVLLLNFERGADQVKSFDDLARLKRRSAGLVVAPHPFFPTPVCLWSNLERYADLFDAVEYNAMFTRLMNFNHPAERWASRHGKPMVGNGDVHRLRQLGTTYSLVDAPRDANAICAAIACGRVEVVSRPLSWSDAASIMSDLSGWRSHAGPQVRTTPASDSTNISLPQSA
jgi:predicted metal-dependent phosphoesterase TrpH